MEEKIVRWVKVAESTAEITQRGERSLVEFAVAGKEICVAVLEDQLFAFAAKCPHAGGRLCQGYLQSAAIVCPLHRYKFQLKNGYNSSGEGYHLKTYLIKETDDGVFIGL